MVSRQQFINYLLYLPAGYFTTLRLEAGAWHANDYLRHSFTDERSILVEIRRSRKQ